MTIEEKLYSAVEYFSDKTAVVCQGKSVTYSQFYEGIVAKARSLESETRRCIAFRFLPTIEMLQYYFAIHLSGHVAMPLEKNLSDVLFQQYEQRISTVSPSKIPEDIADILFTTGTTGIPKGVMISHKAVIANTLNLINRQNFSPILTFIAHGPLNHIGSLSKILPTLLTGGTLFLMDGLRDIAAFFRAIDQAPNLVATFLVPASIRMLTRLAAEKLSECANKMAFIETGAAPLAAADMQKLCQLLPETELFNTYASTETGIVASYNYNDGACIENCMGEPMRCSSISILDDGRIVCHGNTLMSGYLDIVSQEVSLFHGDDFVTNDLGKIDAQGRLHLLGRADDIINVGGFKVSPLEVESTALRLPFIADCVCIPVAHPLMGNMLKLLVVTNGDFDKETTLNFLKERLEAYKIPTAYEQVEAIARTFNGKIDRKKYVGK